MATLTNHRLVIGYELGWPHATAGDEQTLIDMMLNRAVRKVLRDLKLYVDEQTVTPGANANYDLASTVLLVDELKFGGSSGQVLTTERVTPAEIHRLRSGEGGTGTTRYYAAVGRTLLFYPTPGAADTLTMDYVPAPTAMSTGSHDSSNATYGGIPEDYDEMIQAWALHLLASADDDDSSKQGERYIDRYYRLRSEARRELRRVAGRRQGRIRPGRRVPVPFSNSTDVR